jgi:hypothetical protein
MVRMQCDDAHLASFRKRAQIAGVLFAYNHYRSHISIPFARQCAFHGR